MAIHSKHEIHTRRKGRNMAMGLLLGGFVIMVFSVTIVKLSTPQNLDRNALNYSADAGAGE